MPALRILHISDTHVRVAPLGTTDHHPGVDPEERLDAVLSAVSMAGIRPDLAVHTGDITDDDSLASARLVADRLLGVAAQVMAVPGNHDDPAAVEAAFGPAVAQIGAWRVVGVDTTVRHEVAGRVVADVMAAALDSHDTRPTLLALHHPPRSRSTHPWFVLDGADGLLAALSARPHVAALLSGHTHEAYDETLPHGLRLLGAPSTYYPLSHDGPSMAFPERGTGVRLIDLHDDGTLTTSVLNA